MFIGKCSSYSRAMKLLFAADRDYCRKLQLVNLWRKTGRFSAAADTSSTQPHNQGAGDIPEDDVKCQTTRELAVRLCAREAVRMTFQLLLMMFPISCLKTVSDHGDESLIGVGGIPCRCLARGRKATSATKGKQESHWWLFHLKGRKQLCREVHLANGEKDSISNQKGGHVEGNAFGTYNWLNM